MRYKFITGILLMFFINQSCIAIGISSKLDFGEPSPKLIGTATQFKSVAIPVNREDAKSTGDFEDLGVICVSGGCNTTKTNESSGTIEADVVVHVKTSVDVKKNRNVDETPDVPVVVGTGETNLGFRQTRPLVVTNIDDVFAPPTVNNFPSISPSAFQSDGVFIQKTNFHPESQVDIKIKTLPPVTVTMMDDGRSIKDIRYDANGLELRVPYFEPSFHNHYFGENPPPQMIWYPKRTGFVDSVDYKPKAMWKPSFWSGGTIHKHVDSDNCPCKHQPRTGLQWHPTRRVYTNDPGAHIDDKLAPLN